MINRIPGLRDPRWWRSQLPRIFLFLTGVALSLTFSPVTLAAQAPLSLSELNRCDNHEWKAEDWSSQVQTTLAYAQFQNRNCLQAGFLCTAGGQYACIRVDEYFAPEDWSSVTAVVMDVYIQSSAQKRIAIELKDPSDVSIQKVYATDLGTGAWLTVTWPLVAFSQKVCGLFLIPDHLENNDTIYFSNLRLVRNGQEELWESFTAPSYRWQGIEDFVPWWQLKRNEPISHNLTHQPSANALYLPWAAGQSVNDYAAQEATNLYHLDFTQIIKERAWIYSDRSDAPVSLSFLDGTHRVSTEQQTIAVANAWQQLEWNRPVGLDWQTLQSFRIEVNTSAGGSGHVYIDDLDFVLATPTATSTPLPPPRLEGGAAIPNPFFPSKGQQTTIRFRAPAGDPDYSIRIFNLTGAVVRVLRNQTVWDGRNDRGNDCEGGVYLFQVESQGQRVSGQVVLLH